MSALVVTLLRLSSRPPTGGTLYVKSGGFLDREEAGRAEEKTQRGCKNLCLRVLFYRERKKCSLQAVRRSCAFRMTCPPPHWYIFRPAGDRLCVCVCVCVVISSILDAGQSAHILACVGASVGGDRRQEGQHVAGVSVFFSPVFLLVCGALRPFIPFFPRGGLGRLFRFTSALTFHNWNFVSSQTTQSLSTALAFVEVGVFDGKELPQWVSKHFIAAIFTWYTL
ncbi:unnamed protein product [Pylaiella littoralis]